DADLTKTVGAIGECSVCCLLPRDQVRYPSATLASQTDGQPPTAYGERYLFPLMTYTKPE
ncbi:hypothetical protein AVEN_90379-1, partial [Araneus ventricosus]